jgi:hypothetical protein
MALNFPNNPTVGQQYTDPNNVTWEFSGTVWNVLVNLPTGATGPEGTIGPLGATGATGPEGATGAGIDDIIVYSIALG